MKRLGLGVLISTVALSFYTHAESIKTEKIMVTEEKEKEETAYKKEISQEESKITRQIDLGEILFEFYPEIWYMRKAGIANDLNIRGFSRDNINVLIDGSKIYGACPNRMDPPAFHVSSPQIESITIKEGPFDVENAGSLAAVINVKTKNPKEGIGGEVGGTYGSWDYRTGYIWGNIGNNFVKVLVGASNQYSKPYESGEGKKVTEYAQYSAGGKIAGYKPEYINDKAFNIDRVWFKTILSPNNNVDIVFSYAFENARNVLYPALKMDAIYDRTNRINGEFFMKDTGLKFSIYYNEVKHDMRDTFRTTSYGWARGYMMKTYAESKMFGTKLTKDLNLLSVDTTIGIDTYLRNWFADNTVTSNNSIMIPDVNIKDIGLFIKGNKNIANWTVSGGLRYDYNYSKANPNLILNGSNKTLITNGLLTKFSNTDNYISGYLTGKYNINKKDNIYIGIGHTVRAPDPEERFIALSGMSPWYGNPDLKPTKNTEIDLGSEFFPLDNLGLKANIFYSYLRDYIYLYQYLAGANCLGTGSTTCTTYRNINAEIYGFDLNGIYAFSDKISTEIGIAYQLGKKTDKKGIYKDSDLVEIPPLKARLAVKYDDSSIYALVEGIYSAKQSKVDSDLKEIPTGSWFILNIKAGYTYNKRLFVGFGVDNVFDKFYYSYLSYVRDPFRGISINGTPVKIPEPGRFLYANISYRF